MIFSSTLFLFLFLPLTLLGYYIVPKTIRNYWLLSASLVFFAWGGVSYTVILLSSIIVNFFIGIFIQKNIDIRKGWYWLCAGVTINLLLLGIFKYANFLTACLNGILIPFSVQPLPDPGILLPIGISFYTFHAISYLVDIYRGKAIAQKNIFNLSLYIAMFSQLIAGPIIRYSDVWQQLKHREHSLSKFGSGVERFLIGLGKKVLLANIVGKVADSMFQLDPSELGFLNAWLGAIAYTFQIYFDFSGYSDMAIGLGRMFGFTFHENFNYPYLARSIKEFWRKWHMSLSTFFRDYVYIPLGGNRLGQRRTYLNLLVVFLLTGFWHGAGLNFIVWGFFHGFFIILETMILEKMLDRTPKIFSIAYTFLVVMFGWVLFRADTMMVAAKYWRAMFDFETSPRQLSTFYSYMNNELLTVFIFCLAGSFGFFRYLEKLVQEMLSSQNPKAVVASYSYHICSGIVYAGILILSTMYLVAGSYNPFIYYRF